MSTYGIIHNDMCDLKRGMRVDTEVNQPVKCFYSQEYLYLAWNRSYTYIKAHIHISENKQSMKETFITQHIINI